MSPKLIEMAAKKVEELPDHMCGPSSLSNTLPLKRALGGTTKGGGMTGTEDGVDRGK